MFSTLNSVVDFIKIKVTRLGTLTPVIIYNSRVRIYKETFLHFFDKEPVIKNTTDWGGRKNNFTQKFFIPLQMTFQEFHTPTKYLLKVSYPSTQSQAGYVRLQPQGRRNNFVFETSIKFRQYRVLFFE